jgi:hypothetical protein
VFIPGDFKFSDFVSVDCGNVRRRFSGSVDCAGVGDAGRETPPKVWVDATAKKDDSGGSG